MNIKGLKLNKLLAHKIYDSLDTISVANLKGIEPFVNYSWSGFNKEEFKNNLSLFVNLIDQGFFADFDDEFPFVFNYSTDITEMDIVSVIAKGDEQVFLDIESKTGDDLDDLISKTKVQINKRIGDHLPQLLKDKSYIVIGFVNNSFVCGEYYTGGNHSPICNIETLQELLSGFKQSNGCVEYLVQQSNMASIAKICKDIKAGTFRYYEETNRIYSSLINDMDNNNVSIVYGDAGTGKSILALKLLFELPNTKILLMNSKLYFALSLDSFYKTGRATFRPRDFLELIDEQTISIIDECQRISLDTMVEIIRKSKHTFLFGDNKQAFTRKGTLLNHKELAESLAKDYDISASSKKMTKARRYSDEASKSLNMLTSLCPKTKGCKLPDDYEINLFYDENAFLKKYESTSGIKKIYMPMYGSHYHVQIGFKTFVRARYDEDTFSLWNYETNCYGTSYHALSFDVEHCFVVLKNTKMVTFGGRKVIYYDGYYSDPSFNDIQIYLNELNILFTRGRKSLNICVNDIETYLYLNSLITKIK